MIFTGINSPNIFPVGNVCVGNGRAQRPVKPATIPSLFRVHLGHTDRNVSVSYESQHEIALVCAPSRTITDYQQGKVENSLGLARFCFWRFAGRSHRTIRIRIQIAAASSDTWPRSSTLRGRFRNYFRWFFVFPSLRGFCALCHDYRITTFAPFDATLLG